MESHEVLKQTISDLGVKSVAADMNLSSSLIYKWCQPKDSPDAGGAENPLDRLGKVFELTGDTTPIEWLCKKADGYFVKNPNSDGRSKSHPLQATQSILKEFAELLDTVSKSMADDQKIDNKEASRIRKEWDDLKSVTEGFVRDCESGEYGGSEQ